MIPVTETEILTSVSSRLKRKEAKGLVLSEVEAHILKVSKDESPESRKKRAEKAKIEAFSRRLLLFSAIFILCFQIYKLQTYDEFAALSEEDSQDEWGENEDGILGDIPLGPDAIANLAIEVQANQSQKGGILDKSAKTKNSSELNKSKRYFSNLNPGRYQAEFSKVKEAGAKIDPHEGMTQFITGVIAVYLPEALDSGAVAKEIVEASKTEGIDPLYVAAVISVESRFSNKARSHVGAQGLMQIMPQTAKAIAAKLSGKPLTPRLTDKTTNIKLGISYLKEMEARYRGNKALALAAYNWGPANIDKVVKGEKNIPSSVSKYSSTILKKTSAWNRHFSQVTESLS